MKCKVVRSLLLRDCQDNFLLFIYRSCLFVCATNVGDSLFSSYYMIRYFFILCFICLFITFSCYKNDTENPSVYVKEYYFKSIAEANNEAKKLKDAIEREDRASKLQSLFKHARLAYKKTEFLAEYYSPLTAKSINGPPIPEIDVDDHHRISEPEGFQVIEPILFPKYDLENKRKLLEETNRLISNFARLKYLAETNSFEDDQIFDAMRLEVFRVITLGISGFDAPIVQNSIPEARTALLSVSHILSFYKQGIQQKDPELYSQTQSFFNKAAFYLEKNGDFNSFNRMDFIKNYANPLSSIIIKSARRLGIKSVIGLRAVNANAENLFEERSFNPNYFAPNIEAHTSKEKEELGRLLFFDPVLSGTGKRSCASCHQPKKAFSDGLVKNTTISGDNLLNRNTPTVINAGFQPSLFYDGRVSFLEDQATAVITNVDEMHGSMIVAVRKLKESAQYTRLFENAFPGNKSAVNEYHLRNAIASYIRSLTSFNSRFDKYIRGDKKQLNQQEISGFNLYMGKAKCGTCHFTPLFNGTVPPDFSRTETEVIGVPMSSKIKKIDTDPGRFNLRHLPLHKNAFRTPTLRNIALTAPYMHNGIYNSLEKVIDFYNEGGGSGLGIKLENQTLPFDNLKLNTQEKKDIIAFLNTLTDNEKAKDVPKVLPALNTRKKNDRVLLTIRLMRKITPPDHSLF